MSRLSRYLLFAVICASSGCANITAPTGGRKDVTPPKLVSIEPRDSLKNTPVKRIELYFNEYITVNDVFREVQLSPILPIAPTVTGLNKHVVVKIIDSLLEANTTYRLSFGNAIRDLHEGNAFAGFTYTFSTGDYFDSLQLSGTVKNALTGMADMEGVTVALYSASENDSAVARHKPKYVTKAGANGLFAFKGLPKRTFRIFALKDANENLTYDGPGPGDMIGFADTTVIPGDTTMAPIVLRVFAEIPDTLVQKSMDSASANREKMGKQKKPLMDALAYNVRLDTNAEQKTFDISGPVTITFGMLPELNRDKITLTYDSSGVNVPATIRVEMDSLKNAVQLNNARWKENTLYTLKLAKGFAKDTAGKDLMPSKYTFRTKEEEIDYGKVKVNLPGKYLDSKYLLRVLNGEDSVYQHPVTDTVVTLRFLKPGKYTFRIIIDQNRNGRWEPGELFKKVQPEVVIPYAEKLDVKAGWEYSVDFEQRPAPKKGGLKESQTPK